MAQAAINDETADEFEEHAGSELSQYASGYEATRDADVEDQREYRMVPRGTPCTLGIQGFELAKKGKAAIFTKISVDAPAEYADGSSNFSVRMSLNPVIGKKDDGTDKGSSGWDMTKKQLSWLYAAANQVSSAEGLAETVTCVLADFPHLDADDVPAFHAALVDNLNEKLRGSTFKTKGIGVDKGQPTGKTNADGQPDFYRDKQSFGVFDYPKAQTK